MRPLDRLGSIKLKLGVVIVATVAGTVGVLVLGARAGLGPPLRLVLAVVLGLALVQLLAHGMIAPLREMSDAAAAMARGEYGRRVSETSRDEVGELARAFNAMATELAETDRVRRELVADVSHELRTPLGALRALLENLADGVQPSDPAALRTALGQTERLGRLVEQLLALSRLESGTLPLRPRAFPVRPLLERAVGEVELGDVGQGVAVRVAVEPDGLESWGDPERIHQVVANLLDNARRHSPPEGTVWLTAHAETPGRTTLEVADEGPGIPAEEAQRVFERYYRASRDGGTGLGLAIARWIVDAHRGTIRVASRVPRGCRMVIELPW